MIWNYYFLINIRRLWPENNNKDYFIHFLDALLTERFRRHVCATKMKKIKKHLAIFNVWFHLHIYNDKTQLPVGIISSVPTRWINYNKILVTKKKDWITLSRMISELFIFQIYPVLLKFQNKMQMHNKIKRIMLISRWMHVHIVTCCCHSFEK
jgi:hypothetical protein